MTPVKAVDGHASQVTITFRKVLKRTCALHSIFQRGSDERQKMRALDMVVPLTAGKYRLRYKTDDSHSFDTWSALPPDVNFWGIAVYANE